VYRNLGLAYMNKRNDPDAALRSYQTAFELDKSDARVFFELDQLSKKHGASPGERLAQLAAHPELVDRRDDLTIEYVTLLNLTGRHAEALERLLARTFHPWEGGEGKTTGQYVTALVELARGQLAARNAAAAVEFLERARTYPEKLGEGKLAGAQENHIFYFLGLAHAQLGDRARADACFRAAAEGPSELAAALYYNDQPPEMIFYQALARLQLGRNDEAAELCRRLVEYGTTHQDDDVKMDYFAVSLPDFLVFDDDLNRRNRIHCLFMAGLGYLGLGEAAAAAAAFEQVLALEPAHVGATLLHQHGHAGQAVAQA
jgi:tetratricopeptide (TPR) repeat protein